MEKTYTILSIDAWAGVEPNSWEWNNWYPAGTFDLCIDSTHHDILTWFRAQGYLAKGVGLNRVRIEDDQYNLVLTERKTGKPLFAIEYGSYT